MIQSVVLMVVKYRDDFPVQDLTTTIAKFTLEISISFHQVSLRSCSIVQEVQVGLPGRAECWQDQPYHKVLFPPPIFIAHSQS